MSKQISIIKSFNDAILERWLDSRFNKDEVLVSYTSRENCVVSSNNLVTSQVYLEDGRILRSDWISPQHKGEKGRWIIHVELL